MLPNVNMYIKDTSTLARPKMNMVGIEKRNRLKRQANTQRQKKLTFYNLAISKAVSA